MACTTELGLTGVRREETGTAGVRRHVPVIPEENTASPAAAERAPGPAELTAACLEDALDLGCAAAGVFGVESFAPAAARLSSWLVAGYHGTMTYLEAGSRDGVKNLLGQAQTGVVVALPYGASADPGAPGPAGPFDEPGERHRSAEGTAATGRIAKYAHGADYHHALRTLLLELADRLARRLGRPVLARVCVDTAPLLEREAAARAGLAFVGKNTMAIIPGVGSYVLLGELLLDVALDPGVRVHARKRHRELSRSGCGACTTCLDACPTRAFVGPYLLDARRCISYLTIEYAGVIPEELRPGIGAHVFGCDICQDVCPFNRSAHKRTKDLPLGSHPHLAAPALVDLLELTSSAYRRFVGGTALRRVSRARLARNAAVALGNVGDERALGPLGRAVLGHPSDLVRGHAAWALGRVLRRVQGSVAGGGQPLRDLEAASWEALKSAAERDPEDWVRAEAHQAWSERRVPGPRRLPLLH